MAHKTEIIAVGTEILLGNITNGDAQFLSRELSALGIGVYWHTVVGDNPARLREALEIARKRADIIITTGGLGPTYDDLTKQTVCEVFGRPLERHADVVEELRRFYRESLHREMPENNCRQADLPVGCTVFDNAVGTAPGCAFKSGGVHVLMLPGPPFECETMFRRCAAPYLRSLSDEIIVSHDIMCFGIGESSVEQMLHDKMVVMENPTLATYAKPSEVRLCATARAHSEAEAEEMLRPVLAEALELLGDYAYGVDVSGLPETCLRLLKEQGKTFVAAESCTGGEIARRITDISGASAVFRGGVVSYWSEVKRDVLGVPQELLEEYGAVSDPVARAMAEGVRKLTGADIALSVTGVAGPDSDDRGNPVGTVFVGLAAEEGVFCRALKLGRRRRDRIRDLASNHAFDMLRRYLTGLDPEKL